MPLIDVECTVETCKTISEVMRPLAMHPATPPCPKCDGATIQIHLPSYARTLPPAVVVYRAPDGSYRFPGETGGSSTGKYDNLGYERIEARGWAEVRTLEAKLSKREQSTLARKLEREQEFHEAGEKQRRSDVYNGMLNGFQVPVKDSRGNVIGMKTVRMSQKGIDTVRAAIAHNNNKRRQTSAQDTRVHVQVYSDGNNRD